MHPSGSTPRLGGLVEDSPMDTTPVSESTASAALSAKISCNTTPELLNRIQTQGICWLLLGRYQFFGAPDVFSTSLSLTQQVPMWIWAPRTIPCMDVQP